MEKLSFVREISREVLRDLGTLILEKYFRAFTWFCFALWMVTLYAFVLRVSSGFALD